MTNLRIFSSIPLLIGFLFAFGVQATSADIVVSNITNTMADSWDLGTVNGLESVANSFNTGNGPGWNLDSVTLAIDINESAPPDNDFTLFLAIDDAGAPGIQLVDFATGQPSSDGNYTYAPQSSIMLNPNSVYWLVAGHDTDGEIFWANTENLGDTGFSGFSIGDDAFSFNGSNWEPLVLVGSAPVKFEVNATAIPEPGFATLMGLGVLGLFGRRRRS